MNPILSHRGMDLAPPVAVLGPIRSRGVGERLATETAAKRLWKSSAFSSSAASGHQAPVRCQGKREPQSLWTLERDAKGR